MPILDQAFDPATYNPAAIDPALQARLLALGQQRVADAGTGPPGILNGATPPAATMPAGAPPIPLPMPRPADAPPALNGGASPDADAAMPPAAQLTSGPTPPVPDTSLLGRLSEVGKRLGQSINDHPSTLMALGGGLAGAPSLGVGVGRGLTAAVPAMAIDQKQANQNQTVRALIARGLPPDVAQAAGTNPAILQQMLPQLFGPKQRKFTEISTDMLGNKKFGFVDEVNNKVYDLAGTEIKDHAGGSAIPNGPDGQPLSGQALLTHLEKTDPATAAGIKGMLDGTISPSGRNLQKLVPVASLVDPSFDATQFPVRLATRKSYTSGKDFQEVQALNTVAGHMGRLADSAEGLGNSGFKPWNWLKNNAADATVGSPALVKFRNDLVTTQNELAKAYHGGHVSDSAFAAFNKAIGEAQTPAELKTAIGEISGLLKSKIEAKESGYRASMGSAPLPAEFKAVNDEARHAYEKINNWALGVKPEQPAEAKPAGGAVSAPVPPGKYVYDPATGQMVRQQ